MTPKIYPLPPEPGVTLMLCHVASTSTPWLLETPTRSPPRFPTAVLCLQPRVPAVALMPAVVHFWLLVNAKVVTARTSTKAQVGARVRVPIALAQLGLKERLSILAEVGVGAIVPKKAQIKTGQRVLYILKISARVKVPDLAKVRARSRVPFVTEVGAQARVLTVAEGRARAGAGARVVPTVAKVRGGARVPTIAKVRVAARAPAVTRNEGREGVPSNPKI